MAIVPLSGGGPLFPDETGKIEVANQWWRFFENNNEFLDSSMDMEAQAHSIAQDYDAMAVIFWSDLGGNS